MITDQIRSTAYLIDPSGTAFARRSVLIFASTRGIPTTDARAYARRMDVPAGRGIGRIVIRSGRRPLDPDPDPIGKDGFTPHERRLWLRWLSR